MGARHSRIHIVGASGSGVTTLGKALAGRLDGRLLDTDDFFWMPTEPPYTDKRPVEDRLTLLYAALDQGEPWILSGSLIGWGDPLIPRFDLVVFLYVPQEARMARTLARERERYGAVIEPGGPMHEAHQAFIAWSEGYDTRARGRNLANHRAWLARLPCPVIEISGLQSVEERVELVLAA
jgi:adenylate kinase family enzyme